MTEIDQICSQMGPMIEALKLLTCADQTVDLNQTEEHILSQGNNNHNNTLD